MRLVVVIMIFAALACLGGCRAAIGDSVAVVPSSAGVRSASSATETPGCDTCVGSGIEFDSGGMMIARDSRTVLGLKVSIDL